MKNTGAGEEVLSKSSSLTLQGFEILEGFGWCTAIMEPIQTFVTLLAIFAKMQ
jgi:hypothetical protein